MSLQSSCPLPRIVLLSWFGGIVCFDRRQSALVQCGLDALEPWHVPLGVEPDPQNGTYKLSLGQQTVNLLDELLRSLTVGGGQLHQACLTFFNGARYLTALPNGGLALDGREARDWEHFLPLRTHDLLFLREIISRSWRLAGQQPSRVGLEGFQLLFGTRTVSLAENLPFPNTASPQSLTLRSEKDLLQMVCAPAALAEKQIWIQPLGNIGNRALQYLTAAGVAARVPEAEIRNLFLDMWGWHEPAPRPPAWESAGTGDRYHLDVEGLAHCLETNEVNAVCIEGYTFHLEHYPSRAACRALFPAAVGAETVQGFGPHELVCSIRGGEILRAQHPDYFPLPPAYYVKLQEESGLDLVFYGQLGDDPYSQALRAAFPRARFVQGVNQNHVFEVLRRSANLALSISTFAWLAAWLGEAARVYVPVGGMFNPVQHPDQLYLPVDEPSFRYVLLPPVKAVDLEARPVQFWLMQDLIARQARFAGVEEISALIARAGQMGQGKVCVRAFDGAAYLAANPDVAAEVRALRGTALGHYLRVGADEQRPMGQFDPLFYADSYPDAAEAVALGYYPSLLAHFREQGGALGYKPVP